MHVTNNDTMDVHRQQTLRITTSSTTLVCVPAGTHVHVDTRVRTNAQHNLTPHVQRQLARHDVTCTFTDHTDIANTHPQATTYRYTVLHRRCASKQASEQARETVAGENEHLETCCIVGLLPASAQRVPVPRAASHRHAIARARLRLFRRVVVVPVKAGSGVVLSISRSRSS